MMKSQRHRHLYKTSLFTILLPAIPFLVWSVHGQTDRAGPALVVGLPVFDLTWNTIDGGGTMRSTGSGFEMSGTIGQPDAGPGAPAMTGGTFTLTGGFWFALAPGDCNEDGGINLLDYDAFAACIGGPVAGLLGPGCVCFDVDHNGTVDMRDAALFQRSFSGS